MKKKLRGEYKRTPSEWRLWRALRALLPLESIESQWWLPDMDYRVDFYFEAARFIVEVDGHSHEGQEAEDHERSVVLRSLGYEVARVTVEDVMADPDRIAALIADHVDRGPIPDPGIGRHNARRFA